MRVHATSKRVCGPNELRLCHADAGSLLSLAREVKCKAAACRARIRNNSNFNMRRPGASPLNSSQACELLNVQSSCTELSGANTTAVQSPGKSGNGLLSYHFGSTAGPFPTPESRAIMRAMGNAIQVHSVRKGSSPCVTGRDYLGKKCYMILSECFRRVQDVSVTASILSDYV